MINNEEITFWNETLCDISHKLDELYEEKNRIENNLRNIRAGSTNRNLYSPIHYYHGWTRTTVYSIIAEVAEEEKLSKINEKIDYFNKEMNHASDRIDKLYEEMRDKV